MRATVRTEGLNIHDRPDGKKIDALKKGDQLRITGGPTATATVTWWRVRGVILAKEGWVDGRYLSFEAEPVPSVKPPPQYRKPPQIPPDVPHIPTMLDRDEKFLVPVIVGVLVLLALGLLILVATML